MENKCPRVYRLTENETFLSFRGSRKELKSDPTFQRLVEKGKHCIVRHGVTYLQQGQ